MKVIMIRTKPDIHPDIVNWLTEGYIPTADSKIIPFLVHLDALRQASASSADCVIIIEDGTIIDPDFNNKINAIVPKIPIEYDTCLLSHYVLTWDGLSFINGTDKQLCSVNSGIIGSYAYWMRMKHVEHLLAMFDQPLRNIPQFNINPETLTRLGRVCMVHQPLIAKVTDVNQKKYFASYGFKV